MRPRLASVDGPPLAELLCFDPARWSRQEWDAARSAYAARCRSLDELNSLYGPGFDPKLPDPRVV